MSPGRRLTVTLVGLILLVLVAWFVRGGADETPTATKIVPTGSPTASIAVSTGGVPGAKSSGLDIKALTSLPAEAKKTYELIVKDGPFPYPRNDGVTFQNREKRLPQQDSGYYKEYTVPTPGSPDRGARRLVTGKEKEVFYTGDHYSTFVVVDVSK